MTLHAPASTLISPTLTVPVTERCETVIPRLREDSSLKLVVVVDDEGAPVGVLERIETLTAMANPLAYAVFQNRPVTSLMDENFFVYPADGDLASLSTLLDSEQRSLDSGGVVLLDGKVCAGVLPYSAFLSYMVSQDAERSRELAIAHQQVMDSVQYASRIQQGLLARKERLLASFSDVGIIWEPRDIVGGDIFWQSPRRDDGMFWMAIVDCTGHGVPGAMVSMLVASVLGRLWVTHNDASPGAVLAELGDLVRELLNQQADDALSDDGFDAAICRVDPGRGVVGYSGARIGCFLIPRSHDPVVRVNGTKVALGYRGSSPHEPLPEVDVQIKDVSAIVIATDGIFDQPGGPNRRAFGPARMADAISSQHGRSAADIAAGLYSEFTAWMGDQPRRDDVCALVLGF